MHDTLITRDGLERLAEELERLRTDGRREIAERLRAALSADRDTIENGDLDDAREDQALLERRIALLERRYADAQVVEPDGSNGLVDVGERVLLRSLETGEEIGFDLVGSFEADPAAGRLSVASPLGRAVLGLRPGEVAAFDAPKGRLRFEVLAVEAPAAAAAR